jgi:excisionase family DNA binding protein
MPDGRVTEFKSRAIVISDADNASPDDAHVYAVLVNRAGEVFSTPDGAPAVVAVPAIQLDLKPDPDKLVTYADVAKRMGVSLSSVKRMVASGELPKPTKISDRSVRFRQGEVAAAISKWKR